MTKFQEEELYSIYEELSQNQELDKIYNEKLSLIKFHDKYKHRPFFEQCSVSFRKAKKSLAKVH